MGKEEIDKDGNCRGTEIKGQRNNDGHALTTGQPSLSINRLVNLLSSPVDKTDLHPSTVGHKSRVREQTTTPELLTAALEDTGRGRKTVKLRNCYLH